MSWVLTQARRAFRSGFLPTSIAGCVLWLDASDTSTISETANAVTQWDDKSGVGNNATQGLSSYQPTTNTLTQNSLNVIDFDGVLNTMNLPSMILGTSDVSYFMVSNRVSGSSLQISSRFSTSLSLDYTRAGNSNVYIDGTTFVFTGGSPTFGSYFLTSNLLDRDGVATRYENGVLFGTIDISSKSSFDMSISTRITGRDNDTLMLNGQIAEIIIYNSLLGSTDRQAIEEYLIAKWGL